ncbi:MAG: hypothetical protein AAFR61_08400 [Bacteroidota bacterium]
MKLLSADSMSRRWVWAILGLGLVIRVLYAGGLGESLWAGDALGYLFQADQILSGEAFFPYWPPGLPYYLAIWKGLFGESFWGITAWMLTWYVGFHFLLQKAFSLTPLAQRLFLQRAALLLFALFPAFVHHSVAPLTHLPVAVLLLAAWVGWKKGWSPWLLGLMLGLMLLIRPASSMVIPVLGWIAWREKSYLWRQSFLGLMCLLLPLALWQTHTYRMNGYWLNINHANSYNLWLGNHPASPHYKNWWLGSHADQDLDRFGRLYHQRLSIESMPASMQESAYRISTWEHIRLQPGIFMLRVSNRGRVFFAFDTFTGARLINAGHALGWLLLLLDAMCYGLLSVWALKGGVFGPKKRVRPYLWLITAYAFPYLLAFSHPSYHLAVLPFFLLLGAEGPINSDPEVWTDRRLLIGLLMWGLIQLEWIYHMLP